MRKSLIPDPQPVLSREEMDAVRKAAASEATDATASQQAANAESRTADAADMLDGIWERRKEAAGQYLSELDSQADAEKTAYDDYLSELSGQAQEWEALRKAEEDRDKKQTRGEALGGVLLGVGEALSSVINLTGVANGAFNQTPPTYSKDWQKRADEQRKQRQSKMEDLSDRQRKVRDTILQARLAAQQAALNRQLKRSKAVFDAASLEADTAWEQYKYNRRQAADESEAEAKASHQREQDAIARYRAETDRLNAKSNAAYRKKQGDAALTRAKASEGKSKDGEKRHSNDDRKGDEEMEAVLDTIANG